MALCGAKSKRTGKPCTVPAMPNGRCYIHGGKSLIGAALPQFIDGRYSKHLPSRLAVLYAESQSDTDLISVRDELRLVDARTNEVLSRLDSKEAASHWAQLKGLVDQFRSGTPDKRIQAAEALSVWSAEALLDYAVWAEVLDLMERRRKLAETESKRLVAMGQMMTVSQVMSLAGAVIDICRRNVSNRNELSAISREIGVLADREPKD